MKKNLFWSLLTLLVGTFMFYSCSTKEDAPQTEEMTSVSFELNANTISSGTKGELPENPEVLPDPALCNEDNVPLSVDLKLTGPLGSVDITGLEVKEFNGKYKTDPYELPAGTYTVNAVTVYNSSSSTVIYSGVKSPSKFSPFVPAGYFMDQQQFTLLKYTKPVVAFYVLCAKNYNASDFGMPKFELNRMEVTCFDIFFNVCDKNGEHVVGTGSIKVYDREEGTLLYSDTFDGGTLDANNNPTSEGNIATLCFANDLTKDNASESYYIVVKFTNPNMLNTQSVFSGTATVEDLLKFKDSPRWDASMNALHLIVCDGPFCLLPRIICDECDGTLYEDFETYENINDFYTRSGWIVPGGQGDVLEIAPGNKYILAVSPADLDRHRKEFQWTTSSFRYMPNHNIRFNFYVKSEIVDGKPTWPNCSDCNSVPAIVKVRLLDKNGNELLSASKDLNLQGHENNWKLYEAFSFPCDPVLASQCAKAEINVSLKDGYSYNEWVCPSEIKGKYVSYKFGIDNVKSGL
ncbi:MAG: hypothetical protein ACRCX4_13590 [Bacteroidales bacterium]